ncbi:MAG: hypothetical protein AB1791_04675 [Chloroflexota bacterium]
MKRKNQQRLGECVYCDERKPLTDDHVPPKNLFAKPRPGNLITVPACAECNKGFERDDEYFRTMLVLWEKTGDHFGARRLADRVVKDLKRPEKVRFRSSIFHKARPVKLFTKSGLYDGETGLVEVDVLRLHRTVTRTVRGLFYHHAGHRLDDSYEVQIRVSPMSGMILDLIIATLPGLSTTPEIIGDGVFKYWFQVSTRDEKVSTWVLMFFENLPFVCATVPRGFLGDLQELS